MSQASAQKEMRVAKCGAPIKRTDMVCGRPAGHDGWHLNEGRMGRKRATERVKYATDLEYRTRCKDDARRRMAEIHRTQPERERTQRDRENVRRRLRYDTDDEYRTRERQRVINYRATFAGTAVTIRGYAKARLKLKLERSA